MIRGDINDIDFIVQWLEETAGNQQIAIALDETLRPTEVTVDGIWARMGTEAWEKLSSQDGFDLGPIDYTELN